MITLFCSVICISEQCYKFLKKNRLDGRLLHKMSGGTTIAFKITRILFWQVYGNNFWVYLPVLKVSELIIWSFLDIYNVFDHENIEDPTPLYYLNTHCMCLYSHCRHNNNDRRKPSCLPTSKNSIDIAVEFAYYLHTAMGI